MMDTAPVRAPAPRMGDSCATAGARGWHIACSSVAA